MAYDFSENRSFAYRALCNIEVTYRAQKKMAVTYRFSGQQVISMNCELLNVEIYCGNTPNIIYYIPIKTPCLTLAG